MPNRPPFVDGAEQRRGENAVRYAAGPVRTCLRLRRRRGPVAVERRVEAPRAISSAWVPCSTMRPCSRTTIRSASRIVESRCAMTKAVRPASSRRAPPRSPLGADVDRATSPRRGSGCAGRRGARARRRRAGAGRAKAAAALAELACRSRSRARATNSCAPTARGAATTSSTDRVRPAEGDVLARRCPRTGSPPAARSRAGCAATPGVTSRRSTPSIVIGPRSGRRSGRAAWRSSTSRARVADERDRRPGRDVEVDPVQDLVAALRTGSARPRSVTRPSMRG